MASAPGPSRVRGLFGAAPGLLDPDQPARLLRDPAAHTLAFAAFDPGPLGPPDDAAAPAPRLALEISANGIGWRPVPHARRAPGVPGEGTFPRAVNVCGCVRCGAAGGAC
jgi:hypothetical protein